MKDEVQRAPWRAMLRHRLVAHKESPELPGDAEGVEAALSALADVPPLPPLLRVGKRWRRHVRIRGQSRLYTRASSPSSGNLRRLISRAALAVAVLLGLPSIARAGDLLRGGARAANRSGSATAASPNAAVVEQGRANAGDSLARTTQAIQAMQGMQKAAREMAQRAGNIPRTNPNFPAVPLPPVPDGLATGGLHVTPGAVSGSTVWQGATLPVQTVKGAKTKVTITQTAQQALLNWESFNVGKNTTLIFDQSKGGKAVGQWVAINQINDPSGLPSQILGRINAAGQVYLLNQNGILFGGTSQINTHALMASSLPINTNLVARGLLNNPDAQFLFSSLEIPALTSGGTMPAFTPPAPPSTLDGRPSNVVVEKGARLNAPASADKVGGRITLVGPNVRNDGTISTPDGQTILAAGLQVGFSAHATNDPSLRGLDVFVGKVSNSAVSLPAAGTATNAGLIVTPRANVTIAGRSVEQLGVVESSTSVALNGRIDLLASYNATSPVVLGSARFAPGATGAVTLGAGSVTTILPEIFSAETIAATKVPIVSQINLEGNTIHLGNDAQILAPNANVLLRAGAWLASNGTTAFISSGGQIYFEPGAGVSVAGTPDVFAALSQNILSLQLRGSELADSPLQRDGLLRGLTLNLDMRKSGSFNGLSWAGTPLGDATGFLNLIKRNVAQLTTAGGSVKLSAGSSVVMQPGSGIDVSGGWTNFAGGFVETTRVRSGGRILDIANATPDLQYSGIYRAENSTEHPKWGVTETFAHPLGLSGRHWENGYIQGADAGSISITAPAMALDGELRGQSVRGSRQRQNQPASGALALSFTGEDGALYLPFAPTPPALIFKSGILAQANPFAVDQNGDALPLRSDRLGSVSLPPSLLSGFGSLSVANPGGDITVPAGVELNAPAFGSIALAAANLDIAGAISAPGGAISLTAFNISPGAFLRLKAQTSPLPQTPSPNADRGKVNLAAGATLSTAGLVLDERFGAGAPLALDGGRITISGFDVALAHGSTVDVSGGVRLDGLGKKQFGNAGVISIKAGQDPNVLSVVGGKLELGATLRGFAGNHHAGSLELQAALIQIGGAAAHANTLLLAPKFFSTGGFGNFTLSGLGFAPDGAAPAVVIANGTKLRPVAQSWLAQPHSKGGLTAVTKPVAGRSPVSLAFNAPGVVDTFSGARLLRGDVILGEGALIHTDPLASISFKANTVTLLGSVSAPAGQISVAGSNNSANVFNDQTHALTTVELGPRAVLSARGTTIYTPNSFGQRTGVVLAGGNISLSGNILAHAGSLLDVSGTTAQLDYAPAYLPWRAMLRHRLDARSGLAPFGRSVVRQRVDSDGGRIQLAGAQSLQSDASLRGAAGGSLALGGELTISSGRFYAPSGGTAATPLDITLRVIQSGSLAQGPGGVGSVLPGYGEFAADGFARGGFDSLALKGTVEFAGPVSIAARREISVADTGVLFANAAVDLTAPYVKLGTPFVTPLAPGQQLPPFTDGGQAFNFRPTTGGGTLSVHARLLDIGNLSLQNISSAQLNAAGGDIRGAGTLDIAGDLTLTAAQIYPPSALTFTIASESGSVRIVGSGRRQLPLSAGGQLNIYAATIEQGGTLVAPFGGITLGWDGTGTAPQGAITGRSVAVTSSLTLGPGSLTSVSAISPLDSSALTIPFGLNLNDVSWIDPRGVDITGGGAPQKTVTISAANIDSRSGSKIDIRGGGDLFAYRWIKGLGGSRDILAAETSFAVIPGFGADYAPYAPFNPASPGATPGTDPGYVNSSLRVGSRVHLGAGAGLAEGDYTLLPARYALLSGAFLVTPKAGAPVGPARLADGSTLVSGYRFNDLQPGHPGGSLNARFEVAPAETVLARAQYHQFLAGSFLRDGAQRLGTSVPRLPGDAGHLILQAAQAMNLAGQVASQAPGAFRAGLVDIASSGKIVINNGAGDVAGALTLNTAQLNAFGAESLLIGGIRTGTTGATTLAVRTAEVLVDNAGNALRGPEIILVAKGKLTLAAGAGVEQSGALKGTNPADTLRIGEANVAGSGDGVLLRVSSDLAAASVRSGISGSTVPAMLIGAGAHVSGTSLTLASTFATSLDPTAGLTGDYISLNSGQISLRLANAGDLRPTSGLVLGGAVLDTLRGAKRLALQSYSSLDFYGTGRLEVAGALELHAGQIRGFNSGDLVSINAGSLLLDNAAGGTVPVPVIAAARKLEFNAGSVRIGAGQLRIDQFEDVALNARDGVVVQGSGGLSVQGNLRVTAPAITAAKAATQKISAGGLLVISEPAAGGATTLPQAGLGASLMLEGAGVSAGSHIVLPGGLLTLHATSGDLVITGELNAAGTTQTFYDLTRYTDAGAISLVSDRGAVKLGANAVVDVKAAGPGAAGSVDIAAPLGTVTLAGQLHGTGGGSFSLDVGSLPRLDTLLPALSDGGFSASQSFRVRTGNVVVADLSRVTNGVPETLTAKAHNFHLSVDAGNLTVAGTINAGGVRGGSISLEAGGAVTLAGGSRLTVAAQQFDAAGKGGSVSLQTRGAGGGTIDIQSGSSIDLSVAAPAAAGKFTGTLDLRAPQNAAGTDLAVSALGGTISNASRILVEGFRVFDLTGSGNISDSVQSDVFANATTFAAGTTAGRLLAGHPALEPLLVVTPGAEIINTSGNLILGTTTSTAANDWNLAAFRFGPKNAAGVLTLRAAGSLVFLNALSDGFVSSAYNSALLDYNPLLPANAQSWSYHLTAGADFSAADSSRIVLPGALAANSGSLLLGKNAGTASTTAPGLGAQTSAIIGNRFQVIRTGSGDISIAAARDVQLLNQFATIYTAGTQVADPSLGGTFDIPKLIANPSAANGALGAPQQNPVSQAQFTFAGGNISITAGVDLAHYTRTGAGQLIADSQRELPMNWLYRRGFLNQDTGSFGVAGGLGRAGEIASTSWWIDFSNFFQGVGALGGGNVTLTAGRDIANVDAVIPTNARMPKGAPDAAGLVEFGGGDLVVHAGRSIDAGVYYVERGHGTLNATGSIKTNSTRSPSLTNLNNSAALAPETWLPTTLFVGKGGFDVSARGDVLLGPAANPFLLPGGFNNTIWYKTYFSTLAADSFVNVASLAGAVTLREIASTGGNAPTPILQTWLREVLAVKPSSASFFQPWLRLNETSVGPFSTVAELSPGTLRATAFSGDINLVGKLTLSPSATGTVELAAAGALNGLNPNGSATIIGASLATWGSASLNLSDANPGSIPGTATPFAYQSLVGTVPGLALSTGANFLAAVDALFDESGAVRGPDVTLTTKQALHAPGPLHTGDIQPVRLFAGSGNISGLALFSGKAARVMAGGDITDIALYIQNVAADDLTLVAAGRDIIAFNSNSPLRVAARSTGNTLNEGDNALAGDIQLAGPGTLEVIAGRHLDLGIGQSAADGTGVGIVSVGNARNPALPFDGANIIAGAGTGSAAGLTGSSLDFAKFETTVLTAPLLARYLKELDLPQVASPAQFAALPDERRHQLALEMFYLILRDSGRSLNQPDGGYAPGFDAVKTLFSKAKGPGDIFLTSRAIKTQSGGNVSLFAPGGKLAVGFDVAGAQAVDQGILTEAGGNISIFTNGNVDVGTSRIFTLRGGNIVIWSSAGDIAAGAAAKTVAAAPPTRVLIDPQSADVATDLAGLATGGGIGVLATVANIPPGDVDLIAPRGKIDAGDAGIRSVGNLNAAALQVLNAGNIQVSGSSAGTPPAPVVATANLGALTAAASTTGAATQSAADFVKTTRPEPEPLDETLSEVSVEVLGYGGGEN